MTDTIAAREAELIEEFEVFDNWLDRYQYLIDLGRELPEFPESERLDSDKVSGCQSQVWLQARADGDRVVFRAISDAAIVSGLIAVLMRLYSDAPAKDIASDSASFVSALGLDNHLSPSRANGLYAMLERIRGLAQSVSDAA
ncbi:MAG: SufE family protein [Pseudomonadota bacterium]